MACRDSKDLPRRTVSGKVLRDKSFSIAKNINVNVVLSNQATKADLKNATAIDTSKLAAKPNLVS